MDKIPLTQTPTGAWAASSTIRTNLERQGLITRIESTFELTPSATLAGAVQPGGPLRSYLNHRLGRSAVPSPGIRQNWRNVYDRLRTLLARP